jgi:UPF0755 protein
MKKLVVFVLFVMVMGGAAAVALYERVRQPYKGYDGAEQFVEIPQGMKSGAIADALERLGIVRDGTTFRLALWMTGKGRHLQAGEYRFDRPMTPTEVVDKIARGDVFTIPITFPEGLTIGEMAKIFESSGFGPADAFVEAASDASLVRALDPAAKDLEGYLFPDTYALPRKTDGPKLVRRMVTAFERALTPDIREAAAARKLSVRQLVTLASIVEKETAKPDERPLVAAVYQNRLRIGMALQCDPTVIYALVKRGHYNGNIHRDDLMIDSPYNTYRYPGLPPGPIAAPGRAAIDAAAHPADVDFVYFVSRNDGSHAFARTLDEHNRNVQKYQIQYFRERHGNR